MLEQLIIKDFAIIDSVNIEFAKGFTVLSGETGAGKSILIGALSFLLGGQTSVSQIRQGASEASVCAVFSINEDAALSWLEMHGIELENERILIRRFIRANGKSGAWIGNTPVTRTELSEFASFLADIHGQHEHQSLMKTALHRKFLDAKAGIEKQVSEFTALYTELTEKRKKLEQVNSFDIELSHKKEMLSFAVKEISEANLKINEDEILEDEENRLSSYEKLYSSVESICSLLNGKDISAVQMLKQVKKETQHALTLDTRLSELNGRIESCFYELSDAAQEFSIYFQNLIYDPVRLSEVQERLALIYNLKKKYASSQNAPLKEVLDYAENAQKSLERMEDSLENKENLIKEISLLEKQVYSFAKELSGKRKACAGELSNEMETLLSQLGMKDVRFKAEVTEKAGTDLEQKCGPYGIDNIEFLISANKGSVLLPLAKIASGGELSRVMLALKTIFASNDPVQTLIFDEIDTGIGGEIAVSLGSYMKNLAGTKQIFCITHLASIAVYADNQIKIEKKSDGNKTVSNVRLLKNNERISEIARMLSGDSDSQQSLEHAKVMLEKYSGGFNGSNF